MAVDRDSPTAYLEDRPVLSRAAARSLGVVAPLLIALAGALIPSGGAIERLEDVTIDFRFRARGPRQPPGNIIIVEIDEQSRQVLKQGDRRFDLRANLAPAVENLAKAGALVVGLDVWLTDLTSPDVDVRLAEAVGKSDVVLAAAYAGGQVKRAPKLFRASEPLEGMVSVSPDNGVLRRLPETLYLNLLGDSGSPEDLIYLPHFPLVLALFAAWEKDESAQINIEGNLAKIGPYSARARELIDFAAVTPEAGDGKTRWRTLRFEDAVHGAFDPAKIAGTIVLIGEVGILRDSFAMPLADGFVPGVYYHANALAQILEDRHFAAQWNVGLRNRCLVAGLTFLAGLFAWNQRQWWMHRRGTTLLLCYVLAGVALFPGGWTWLATYLFDRGILLPVVKPLAGMGMALATGLACQLVVLNANTNRLALRTRRIEAMFGQSVSQQVLDALKAQPERILETQQCDVSVLFCDLRNFTAISSSMAPVEVAEMLNEYFNHITAAVFENDGFIDKFVGDEVMAVFSVPFEQPDHPARAVRTAVAIKQRLGDLNRLRLARGRPALNCGLGIHCGPAAAGHIGSIERSNYTVVGNTVNLAARIELHTKGGEILISKAMRERLPPEFGVTHWGSVEIRGTDGLHELYEVSADDGGDA